MEFLPLARIKKSTRYFCYHLYFFGADTRVPKTLLLSPQPYFLKNLTLTSSQSISNVL